MASVATAFCRIIIAFLLLMQIFLLWGWLNSTFVFFSPQKSANIFPHFISRRPSLKSQNESKKKSSKENFISNYYMYNFQPTNSFMNIC